MVGGASLTSIGIPNLGCGEEWDFIQCKQLNCGTAQLREQQGCGTARQCYNSIMKQHGCGTAWLWGSPGVRQPHLPCSTLISWEFFSVSTPAGNIIFILWWKIKVCFPPLTPDLPVLMQIKTPYSDILIGPKGAVLIGQNRAPFSDKY